MPLKAAFRRVHKQATGSSWNWGKVGDNMLSSDGELTVVRALSSALLLSHSLHCNNVNLIGLQS